MKIGFLIHWFHFRNEFNAEIFKLTLEILLYLCIRIICQTRKTAEHPFTNIHNNISPGCAAS